MSEEYKDHPDAHPPELEPLSEKQIDSVSSLASNISALIISHDQHQHPEPEVHQPSVPEIISEKLEELKEVHHCPEDPEIKESDQSDRIQDAEPSHSAEPEDDSGKLIQEPEQPQAKFAELYRSLLSSKASGRYLPPFLNQLRSEGKFHETLLLNYLSNSGDFLNESTVILNNKEVKLENLTWTSRSLQISHNQILFVGGNNCSKNCFILNTNNYEVTQIASLKNGRDLHSLTWIDGKPAAIGGFDKEAIDSVEVLEDQKWVKRQGLNEARYGHSSVYHAVKTWVFGGAKEKSCPVNSIEIYLEGNWQKLGVKLPFNKVGTGILGVGDKIFLLGGFTDKKTNSNKVVSFNLHSETFENEEEMEDGMSFSQNLWKLSGEWLEGYGFRGRRISYRVR